MTHLLRSNALTTPSMAPNQAAPMRVHSRRAAPRRQPVFTLVLGSLILVYVWRIQDLYPILAAVQFPILVTVAGLGWFFANGGFRKTQLLFREPAMKAAFLMLALMVVGTPFSLYQGLSFSFILNDHLKTFVVMLAIAAGVSTYRDIERLVTAQLVGGFVFAWLTITKFSVGMGGRLGDLPYYDANDLGMLMVVVIPMAAYYMRPQARISAAGRLLTLPALVLFAMSIAKSGSRGAFIGLVGVAIYLIVGFRAIKPSVRIGAALGAFVVLGLVGGDAYWELMSSLLHPTSDYNWSGGSDTGRMEIWKRGMTYMFSNPILGVGVRCFTVAEGTLAPQAALQEYGIGFKWSAAHNSFVQIGAELGIGGLLLFIGMIGAGFAALRKVMKEGAVLGRRGRDRVALAQALTASLVGFVLAGFFLSQAYGATIYLLIAMIVALSRVSAADAKTGSTVSVRPQA